MSVPNLKRIAQFIQKVIQGSENLEIRSRDPGHAHLRSFYNPYAGRVVLYVCTTFEADSCIQSKVIKGPKISKLVT